MPFIFDIRYLIIVGPFFAFAAWCTGRVKTTFLKYQNVGVRSRMTGAQAAAAVARAGGADVNIERVGGFLSNHYDPRTRTLRLSPEVHDGYSISSIAVAAHEAGHAIQHVREYPLLAFRSGLVPLTIIGNKAWGPLFFVGLIMSWLRMGALGYWVALAGVGLFGLTIVSQIATLPVEFDATKRAKLVLAQTGIVSTEEEAIGVRKVLGAAALTYVAGALLSLAQLLYYLMLLSGRRD